MGGRPNQPVIGCARAASIFIDIVLALAVKHKIILRELINEGAAVSRVNQDFWSN
jgi:hypothetical protein